MVLTTCSGYVTVDEIIQNAKRLCVDPDFNSTFSELIDLREFRGTNATAADLSDFSEEHDPFSLRSRRAVFAPSELAFGMARMYEIVRGEAAEFGVFRAMEEACRWLGVERWAPVLAELPLWISGTKTNAATPSARKKSIVEKRASNVAKRSWNNCSA